VSGRRSLARALVLSVAGGAIAYVAIAAYVGAGRVEAALRQFHWSAAAVGLGLAALNYCLRFFKWELYLRVLRVRIPWRDSLAVFLSGFALTVTPGKIGEVLKAYLVRELHGVPMARTAPTVVAERVTDLLALVVLAAGGVGAVLGASGQRLLWVAGGLVVLFVVIASWRPAALALIGLCERAFGRLPVAGKLVKSLRPFYDAMALLLRPGPLVAATLISIAAWAAECVAFWAIVRAFPGVGPGATLLVCTFIYAAMTIAGALSFVPGGLLVQEGGMVGLLVALCPGMGEDVATASTFVTRLCTLWFAVLVGVVALLALRRRVGVELEALKGARSAE
jgi:uncharacterized protein (TIRG00374 family)